MSLKSALTASPDEGKIKTRGVSENGDAQEADTTLPDPTPKAKWWLLGLIASAFAIAGIWTLAGVTRVPFDPSLVQKANFALFAGFYVAAQIIVVLMALVAPLLPPWGPPTALTDETAKAAQLKADRVVLVLGLSTVVGVVFSCSFGLYFLSAIGMQVGRFFDVVATALVIAGGAKPLQDFIASIQNKTTPKTKTSA